jgi:hypothetical protein
MIEITEETPMKVSFSQKLISFQEPPIKEKNELINEATRRSKNPNPKQTYIGHIREACGGSSKRRVYCTVVEVDKIVYTFSLPLSTASSLKYLFWWIDHDLTIFFCIFCMSLAVGILICWSWRIPMAASKFNIIYYQMSYRVILKILRSL